MPINSFSAKIQERRTRADLPPAHGTLGDLMGTLPWALLSVLRAGLMPRTTLALENAALRQQLTIYQRTQRRARLRDGAH
jgi:hypothetical protein